MTADDPTLGIDIGEVSPATLQTAIEVRPAVWTKYAPMSNLELPDVLSRNDLVAAGENADWAVDDDVKLLFVLTMMWGSGTANGRGPRYTSAALEAPSAVDHLRRARQLVLDGDVPAAYDMHKSLPGIGPSFHTKWLWIVGRAAEPQPLILDALVWKSLGDLGWNSKKAAGSSRWGERYVAYLRACKSWAASAERTPEDVEFTLFARAKR